MHNHESEVVAETLQHPEVHRQWEDAYRTVENEAFYELAFDHIVDLLKVPRNSLILDVGCGSCAHSIRLVQRGFSVLAVDFSDPVLQTAAVNIKKLGIDEQIKLQRQDILSLSYANQTFDYILCWGVLMHIPEIEKAISELDRVLKNKGVLVIGENNMVSFQAILRRSLWLLKGTVKSTMNRTEAGLEWWTVTPSGKLLTRYADISWLIKAFTQRGYTIKEITAGQFSEFYLRMPTMMLKKLIHGFNELWFKYIRNPNLAFGNILIVQKSAG